MHGAAACARACVVSLVVCLASVGGGEFRCRILLSRELVREIESKRERGRKKLRGRGLLRDLRGLSPPQKHRKKRGVALRFLSPVLCFCPVLPLCRATVVAIPVTKATRASVDVRARARAQLGCGVVGLVEREREQAHVEIVRRRAERRGVRGAGESRRGDM